MSKIQSTKKSKNYKKIANIVNIANIANNRRFLLAYISLFLYYY